MLVSSSLFSLLLAISLPVDAAVTHRDSPVNLPLEKRLNFNLGPYKNLVLRDRARVQNLRGRGQSLLAQLSGILVRDEGVINEPVVNNFVSYTASIGVGNPPKTYELLVDTGSSNTWIGAQPGKPYQTTNTSFTTPNTVSVEYGSGFFSGNEFLDRVTLGGDLVLTNQSIGVANQSQGLDVDGILGIGPQDLTLGTLSPARNQLIPTVTDTAFNQSLIEQNQIGVYFEPITSPSNGAGQLTYGGVDQAKFTGSLTYTNVTTTRPASAYWGIDQTVQYGSETLLNHSAGIVDTGTTLMLIASDAFAKYRNATGAVEDPITGLLRITPDQFSQLKSLTFQIAGKNFDLTPNAQLWPRSLNTAIGGSSDFLYLIVADIGTPSGVGLDFINGYTFLERFYTSYDTANKRVGFAPTNFTTSSFN